MSPDRAVNAAVKRKPTERQAAHQVRRLFARKAALEAELRQVNAQIAEHGNHLSDARGYRIRLRGPALLREACRG